MACQPRQVFTRFALAAAIASVLPTGRGFAQERDRSKIPDKYKWNTADVYPSEEAWRAAKERLLAEIPKLKSFRGALGTSAARLADALELLMQLNKELGRAYVYASMLSDEDTRVSKYQGMQQEMVQVNAQLGAEAAFIEPEILKTDRATIDRFVGSEPRLEAVPDVPRRHPAPASAHQIGCRGKAARRGVGGRLRTVEHLRRLFRRRLPLSDGDAQRRARGKTRQLDLQRRPHVAEPRGSAEGDVVVLRRAGHLSGDVWRDAELADPVGHFLCACAGLSRRRSKPRSTARTFRRRCTRGWSTASTSTCPRSIAI